MIRGNMQPKLATFITSRKEQKRFVKFAIVGLIGAIVDLAVFNGLISFANFSPPFANTISVFIAICSNFVWNRFWSFPESRQRPIVGQFFQFLAINAVGWALNQLIFNAVWHLAMPRLGIYAPWDYNLAKLFAIGIILFWNFGINRLTTYKGL